MPLSAQMEQRRNSETQKALEEINQALVGFAVANGRLPCPADPTLDTSNASAGVERATCTGANQLGVIPWKTLGVSETDGWNRRITYRVTDIFADGIATNTVAPLSSCTATPTQSSFALCSQGNLSVRSSSSDPIPDCTTQNNNCYPAIALSLGKNGYGAYTTQGTQLPTAGAGTDEVTNATASTVSFINRGYASNFDDLVTWLSPNILFNRMVAAGKLP
jgi:type II secretory pathway pseudopilin PulG